MALDSSTVTAANHDARYDDLFAGFDDTANINVACFTTHYESFALFSGFNVPAAKQIDSAVVSLVAINSFTDSVPIRIYGWLVDNALASLPTDNAGSLALPRTTAYVDWVPTTGLDAGTVHETPDLSTIVQEIIDRVGYDSAGGIGFLFTDAGASNFTGVDFASYDDVTYDPPALDVEYSDPPQPPPAAPSNLVAVINPVGPGTLWNDSDEIILTWTDNSDDETNFELQRSGIQPFDEGGGGIISPLIDPNLETFTDSGLTPNVIVYYRLRAVNANGNSDWSNTASALTVIPSGVSIPTLPRSPSISIGPRI